MDSTRFAMVLGVTTIVQAGMESFSELFHNKTLSKYGMIELQDRYRVIFIFHIFFLKYK